MSGERFLFLNDRTRFGGESGAGLMRNRCAFTSKDMAAEFGDAFAYAIVLGWDADEDDLDTESSMPLLAEKWGWDEDLIDFLRDAHDRFLRLSDKAEVTP